MSILRQIALDVAANRWRYVEYVCQKTRKFTKKGHGTPCPVSEVSGTAKPFRTTARSRTRRALDFQYDVWFTVILNLTDPHVLLKAGNMVFLLHEEKEALGNLVYLFDVLFYHLVVKSGQTRFNDGEGSTKASATR